MKRVVVGMCFFCWLVGLSLGHMGMWVDGSNLQAGGECDSNPLSLTSSMYGKYGLPRTAFTTWNGDIECDPVLPEDIPCRNLSAVITLTGSMVNNPGTPYSGRAYARLDTSTGVFELYVVHNVPYYNLSFPLEWATDEPLSTGVNLDFIPNYTPTDGTSEGELGVAGGGGIGGFNNNGKKKVFQEAIVAAAAVPAAGGRARIGARFPPCRCCSCRRGFRSLLRSQVTFIEYLNGRENYPGEESRGMVYDLHISTVFSMEKGGEEAVRSLLSGCSTISVSSTMHPFGEVGGRLGWCEEPDVPPTYYSPHL